MSYNPPNPNGQTTMAASAPVVIASNQSSLPVAATLQASSGVDIGKLTANQTVNNAQINGVTPLMGNGVSGTGAQRVSIASDSTGQVAPAANATSTGVSISYQAALTNTKVSVKTSAGNLYGYRIYNPNTTVAYIQLFNILTASVTLGTTAPTDVIAIPAGGIIDEKFAIPDTYNVSIIAAATTTASGLTALTSTLTVTFRYA